MLCDPVFSAKRVGRYWIPDSTFLELRIPDSQTQDSGSHKQKFSRFRIVQAKICSIPDCTSKNFLNSGLYKQKFSSIPDHYKQKFSRFRIVQAKISWIAESEFPFMGQMTCWPVISKFEKWIYSKSTPAVAQLSHKKLHLYSWHFKRKWRDKVTDSCTHN